LFRYSEILRCDFCSRDSDAMKTFALQSVDCILLFLIENTRRYGMVLWVLILNGFQCLLC
jgi:hypothetical protein